MDPSQTAIAKGREVVRIEGRAVAELEGKIGESFARAVDLVQACRGRVIVTGVGKSGIIARKIVATMNSTGTPSVFLHPTDAVHGDLGIVRDGDVVICISKSGSTAELSILLPMFRRIGVPVISLVGSLSSPLASESTVVLDVSVREEACPLDLAPTSSTTAALALGDALAIALLDRRPGGGSTCRETCRRSALYATKARNRSSSENDFRSFHRSDGTSAIRGSRIPLEIISSL